MSTLHIADTSLFVAMYQLNDSVNVEALEQILNSSDGDVKVQFTVEGIRLAVTPESADVLIDEEPCSPDQ